MPVLSEGIGDKDPYLGHVTSVLLPTIFLFGGWKLRNYSVSLLQGLELCRVVAVHVETMLSAREERLTLPPSEITLL